jgi:hypothetical protein
MDRAFSKIVRLLARPLNPQHRPNVSLIDADQRESDG